MSELTYSEHKESHLIDAILSDRGSTYGDYNINVTARASIMKALNEVHFSHTGNRFDTVNVIMFSDLVAKLVRLAATPKHLDSIIDLQGYAKLYQKVISENKD